MNTTDHAEYTQPCIECGALFVLRDSGRPPKFCGSVCRKRWHRKLSGTKAGTKAPPALVDRVAKSNKPLDIGLELIRLGKMPGADCITRSGSPAWTFQSICTAFCVEPHQLRGLLPEKSEIRLKADSTEKKLLI